MLTQNILVKWSNATEVTWKQHLSLSRLCFLPCFWVICSEQQQKISGDVVWFKQDQSSRSCAGLPMGARSKWQTYAHAHVYCTVNTLCASCRRARRGTQVHRNMQMHQWKFFSETERSKHTTRTFCANSNGLNWTTFWVTDWLTASHHPQYINLSAKHLLVTDFYFAMVCYKL